MKSWLFTGSSTTSLAIPSFHIYPQALTTGPAKRMIKTVHLISDSTGETIAKIGEAALALFPGDMAHTQLHVFVRNENDATLAMTAIAANPGPVFITMADRALSSSILKQCSDMGLPALPAIDPVVKMLETHFQQPASYRTGGQYKVDDLYFRRVDAIDYAINHDDGAAGDRLSRADVILTGVSRTSKTPTCIYLAVRGIKAANLPLIPGIDPPKGFFDAVEAGVPVIAITASPTRLAQIRSQRLETIGHDKAAEYAALDAIRAEVSEARLLFERINAPVSDVTRRSIEETAAAIMAILRQKAPSETTMSQTPV
jgi:regulator of PEP synthase PpsR (kinase-PPPase family)